MISISFDNPYLLFLAIPMLAIVVIPYAVAIRKENRSASTVITLITHTVMVALVTLALAGMHQSTVMTETEVVVVADVSYSTDRELDTVDAHIKNLQKEGNLPENSKLGVVCFGKDYVLNTDIGGKFKTVKGTSVDTSATDISGALDYASTLFSKDAVKRIVLITDGKQNVGEGTNGLINSIKMLEAKEILVDAIYTDSNLKGDDREVQITSIEYISSTYLNAESTLKVLIQSNTDYVPDVNNPKDRNDAYIHLYNGEGVLVKTVTEQLQKGFNMIEIPLDTSVAGTTDYKVVVEALHDVSAYNNEYSFTQSVSGKQNVLLVSTTKTDLTKAEMLYGDSAEIYAPLLLKKKQPVPYSLEELCNYDEIILSDIDVNTIDNATAFIANLNTVVSKFGKSLITAGNTFIQNKEDKIYKTLEDMLAIKYGNTDGDAKIYALVIDSSRSMQDAYQLIMAKETAIQLLNMMAPTDFVTVISFSGEVSVVQRPIAAVHKEEIIQTINAIKPTQGTVLGAGLRVAHEQLDGQPFYEKRVLLISDGRSYASVNETDDAVIITAAMARKGIYTSVINTNSPVGEELLTNIQKAGKGEYYLVKSPEEVKDVVSTDIADDLTETVVEKDTPIIIEDYNDPLVDGIISLPNIGGYYYGKVKSNATIVLSVDYKKPSGMVVSVPIYSYWNYGNGKVASLSTTFSGSWVSAWEQDTNGKEVFSRVLTTNTPKERIDHPFNLEVSFDGSNALLEIFPGEINPDIVVDIEITAPNEDKTTTRLFYEEGKYFLNYEAKELGKYQVYVKYVYGDESFDANTTFDVVRNPEYNSFELFDSAVLYNALGNSGSVIEKGELKIENDESQVDTYVYYFTIPLMIAAVALFVVDVIIRKLKWKDIKSIFGMGKKGESAK